MSVLAAPDDTWGIPGPTFLRIYLAVAVVVVVAALVHRFRLFAGPPDAGRDPLGPQQAAYLNGGAPLAVHASVGGLRGNGAIGVGPDHRLTATGPLPAGVTPLDQAVHHAAGQRARVRELREDQWVAAALHQLGEGLEQRGLILPAQQRAAARLGAAAVIALLILGGLRAFVGLSNGRPVGYLFLSLVALFVALLFLGRVPRVTRAGRRAMRDLRRQHTHLAPASSPAYATYGAAGAAMGVALFGTASLWALDPAFAAEAEIQRQNLSGGGGGGSDGGGSSCGGGGGGGGCGGGGCGG
ncbi:TIGR04222 domain-containing membrane protein [Micromonospora sp. WMMD812]|uniref:TIGR04222 domain-containing membrane protein n=1 Tax=Micromonospora sp. WMMD812 TaxID=3015152 RepID=UPI00248AB4C4|nr:TIGR04222 domain-containing membrane protein [Micromonospora sp. WMMD812]WBB67432.1 TIGR04222 domain-containing membrane protein [Micromonospora sp. WMMD812]